MTSSGQKVRSGIRQKGSEMFRFVNDPEEVERIHRASYRRRLRNDVRRLRQLRARGRDSSYLAKRVRHAWQHRNGYNPNALAFEDVR